MGKLNGMKLLREALAMVKTEGLKSEVRVGGSGHYRLTVVNGDRRRFVTLASSPGGGRCEQNQRADVRRAIRALL